MSDTRPRRGLHPPLVGLIDSGDHLEQRRFASAVPPDETDMGLGRKRGRGPVEHEVAAKPQRDAVKREHNAGLIACGTAQSFGLLGLPS
jgi:hypothetical protein